MGLCETEALVLRTYNLAEADKIVVCLTRASGLVRGVAKGSRRLKNRFGAALEPFTVILLSYYQNENRDLASLRNVEILNSHFNLSSQAETLPGLCYMADLVIEFSPPHQPNDHLFRMVKACLEAVATSPVDLHTILRYFEVWLLKLEGFLPDIRQCAECQLVFDEKRTAFVGLDLSLRCRSCNHGGTAISNRLHGQLQATQKLGPHVFAEESRRVPPKVLLEMEELTRTLIARVLERQPRVRPTLLN
ncbi:MAG TPA: DNA repair protein RecO [Pyrinomonadaceae bacterium]|nr:DNA repair protein RecO [Pyrinomonadaceae bacterium]